MKNLLLLILLLISFILFVASISIPGTGTALYILFVVTSIAQAQFSHQVLATYSLKGEKRISLIVAIVCLPMIGKLVYIIVQMF
jgi:hypothetical protein